MDVTGLGFLAIVAGVLAGSVTNRITGLGFSLVCSPVMVLVLGPRDGVRLLNMVSIAVSLSNVVPTWRWMRRTDLVRLLVPALAWTPLAAAVVRRTDEDLLLVGAGVVTLVAALFVFRSTTVAALQGRAGAVGAGTVSATMNVIGGLSGPPVAMYALNGGWSPAEFRGTLQAYFLALNVVAVWSLGPVAPPAGMVVGIVAAVLGGLVIGGVLAARVAPSRFRTLVIVVVCAGALAAIARGLSG